jgi:hypothetical protein
MYRGKEKWVLVGSALGLSAVAAVAFAAAAAAGGWPREVLCPVSLWWAGVGAVVGLTAAFSRPGPWPRDRRARYVACLNAAVVGGWIACHAAVWPALAVLPLYVLAERAVFSRLWPPDATGTYTRPRVWLTYVVVGQLAGYAAGAWTHSVLR